ARALNRSMPVSISHAHPSPGVINPPSLSGMETVDARNSPTYLSQQPQPSLPKAPPVPPSPVISPATPALAVTPTGYVPAAQLAHLFPRLFPAPQHHHQLPARHRDNQYHRPHLFRQDKRGDQGGSLMCWLQGCWWYSSAPLSEHTSSSHAAHLRLTPR